MTTFPLALGIPLFWWFAETAYFGWNASPSNSTELLADGLALLLVVLALLIRAIEHKPRTSVIYIKNIIYGDPE
jgi:hypothetical protein